MRLFPGNVMQSANGDDDNRGNVAEQTAAAPAVEWEKPEPPAETDVVDGDVVREIDAAPPVVDVEAAAPATDARPAESRAPRPKGGRRAKTPSQNSKEPKAPKARKTVAKPRTPRVKNVAVES